MNQIHTYNELELQLSVKEMLVIINNFRSFENAYKASFQQLIATGLRQETCKAWLEYAQAKKLQTTTIDECYWN